MKWVLFAFGTWRWEAARVVGCLLGSLTVEDDNLPLRHCVRLVQALQRNASCLRPPRLT